MAKPNTPAPFLQKAAAPEGAARIRRVRVPFGVMNYRFPATRTATIQNGMGAGMLGINPITQGEMNGTSPKNFKRLYGQPN